MKSLTDYIKESCDKNGACADSKTFVFNIKGMDNVDELKKSLESLDNVEIADDKITVTACKECELTKKAFDILNKYSNAERSGSHRTSDEQYAQKTVQFEAKVKELDDYMKEEAPEENNAEKETDKKEDEDKKEDKEK